MNSGEPLVREHRLFWMLARKARRRDDVGRVYLAIQAALAHGRDTVDVGSLMGAMMPEGHLTMTANYEGIGASGLAHFDWLFKIELVSAGECDCHEYLFHRRHDKMEVIATLKTATAPRSLQFQQEYAREHRRLAAKRAHFLAHGRW